MSSMVTIGVTPVLKGYNRSWISFIDRPLNTGWVPKCPETGTSVTGEAFGKG